MRCLSPIFVSFISSNKNAYFKRPPLLHRRPKKWPPALKHLAYVTKCSSSWCITCAVLAMSTLCTCPSRVRMSHTPSSHTSLRASFTFFPMKINDCVPNENARARHGSRLFSGEHLDFSRVFGSNAQHNSCTCDKHDRIHQCNTPNPQGSPSISFGSTNLISPPIGAARADRITTFATAVSLTFLGATSAINSTIVTRRERS